MHGKTMRRRIPIAALASALALVPAAGASAAVSAKLAYVTGIAALHPVCTSRTPTAAGRSRSAAASTPRSRRTAPTSRSSPPTESRHVARRAPGDRRRRAHAGAGERLDRPARVVARRDAARGHREHDAACRRGRRERRTARRRARPDPGRELLAGRQPDRLRALEVGAPVGARERLRRAGRRLRRDAITHDGRSLYPVWGPTRIAYTRERLRRNDAPVYQLRVMQPDGSGVRQLTHMSVPRLLSGLDGDRLVGRRQPPARRVRRPGHERGVDGRRQKRSRARPDRQIRRHDRQRTLSPDGSTVLVQRGYFDDPEHQSVATVPFGGGRATVLVRHGSEPSWGG